MKDLKTLNTIEMGIDVNDVKILINAGFQYLMKTCHQWAKDHPLVSGVLLFFYLLYIFFPSLFSILFYTFPLVICTAILLGGSHIRPEKHNRNIKDIKNEDDKTRMDHDATTNRPRRPYLQPQMSRRTFGKDKGKELSKIEGIPKEENKDHNEAFSTKDDPIVRESSKLEGIPKEENKDHAEAFPTKHDPIVHESPKLEEMPVKSCDKNSLSHNLSHVKTSSSPENTSDNHKIENFTKGASRSDTESQEEDDEEDDDEPQEETNKVMEWTEDDQRNLMDLGTSEIERNKRLESLIAKRRARKLLSMQPRRNHFDYLGDYHPYDYHLDSLGAVTVVRDSDDGEHQPGSAPSVLLPTRNPFDLPYDPHEEKPNLTGGSFEEEFFGNEQKDMPFCNHGSFSHSGSGTSFIGELKDDPISKSLPSFFMKPRAVDKPPGYSRFRRESDAEESIKDIAEELAQEGNDQTSDPRDSPQEAQISQVQNDCHDQATTITPEKEFQKLETGNFAQSNESVGSDLASSMGSKRDEELGTRDNEEENIFQMESEATTVRDEVQQSQQDQLSVNNDHDECEESSSSSSSSSSCEIRVNASKNEAFRNSVKKVLTCLVREKALLGKGKVGTSSSDLMYDSSPTTTIPTKMEERSYYTSRPRHTPTYSIASDMQVEVSEAGSPTAMAAIDPNSPTDRESLVYDGDVDKDVNSGDEDLWGTSPHPMKFGDFGGKFKLPDIIEENGNRGSDFGIAHHARDRPTLSRGLAEEAEQAPEGETASSLSPRSILPEDNRKELKDNKSTDGDIIEPRSSVSSSSDGQASQMRGKSEHLAEYLANLPPTGTGSNVIEDPGPSHVRKISAEEITIQDESNPMFEMDEEKDEPKDSKELEESQEKIEQSSTTCQSEMSKATSSSSNDYFENKEQNGQAPFIAEQSEHSRRLEDDSSHLENSAREADTSFREPPPHENEAIIDTFLTACADQSISAEEPRSESEKEMKVTPGSQIEEVKVESPNKGYVHDELTSSEVTGETSHVVCDANKIEVEETSEQGEMNSLKRENRPQLATIEDANLELGSSTEVVSSRPMDDPRGNLDNLPA